jgi:hypothetical protein
VTVLHTVPANPTNRDKTVMDLTKFSSDFLWNQFVMSFLYDCWRVDENTCLVKLAEEEVTAEDDLDQIFFVGRHSFQLLSNVKISKMDIPTTILLLNFPITLVISHAVGSAVWACIHYAIGSGGWLEESEQHTDVL